MSRFVHAGLKVSYTTNNLGNTTVWVTLGKDVDLNAVMGPCGEIHSITLSYSANEDTLWFGEFTMEANTPGNAQVQVAPWLPMLLPIFAKCKSVSA